MGVLNTNILIHRENDGNPARSCPLFQVARPAYYQKVHPASIGEIGGTDPKVRTSFATKLASYHELKTLAPLSAAVQAVGAADVTENDKNDTLILNELHADRVDFLITEDRPLARKAAALGIADRVFTIDAFLEKVTAENPKLVDYKILSVRKMLFGQVQLADSFFDSFRQDYVGFDKWFNKKSDEIAYVCQEQTAVAAFLYLKPEGPEENYADIEPIFKPKRRLKIGTLKVNLNGYKLGERFLKIIFDNAIRLKVDEIYVTIFPRSVEQQR